MDRRLIVIVLAVLFVPVAASAQANREAAAKAIEANERAVLAAIQKHDAKGFFAGTTGPDGVLINPGGVSTFGEFAKTMNQVTLESFTLDQVKVTFLTDTSAILSYRFTGKGTYMGQPLPQEYASSAYVNRNGKWLSVVHQETPIAPPPPPAKK